MILQIFQQKYLSGDGDHVNLHMKSLFIHECDYKRLIAISREGREMSNYGTVQLGADRCYYNED